jgi:Rrf2 family iron-sulfur cluster assembly transcriptional regulator
VTILFSKSCEYAVQAVLLLAANTKREPVFLREISDRLDIPHHYLSKVLQQLNKDGIVVSHKGQSGGYILGRHPDQITLDDVVRSIDGKSLLHGCVLGFSECSERDPCPVCGRWTRAKRIITDFLEHKSVAELSKGFERHLLIYTSPEKHLKHLRT